ncbi:helix-turn-helix domain-containing protein [Clostridium saccharoperbutylacetonicum]|uniref:helix-turn-helix domain-containing protein n=1 Tax=Clostridium saccharoperbutylacetonicum TaxID=36745 RepID=UPI0039E94249
MFGERLKALRENYGLTQNDLATKVKVARTTITGYENNTNQPDFDTLARIATVFNVSLDYLLGRTNQKYNPIFIDEDTNKLLEKINILDEITKQRILKLIPLPEDKWVLLLDLCGVLESYKILKD